MGVLDSRQNLNRGWGNAEETIALSIWEPVGPFALLNLRLDCHRVLTKAGSKAKCKDPGVVCKPLYQILLSLSPRLGVGFPAERRLWREGEQGHWVRRALWAVFGALNE